MNQFTKDNNTFDASWKLYDAERMANESLRQRLAAAQAREQQLREALIVCVCAMQDYQAGIGITEMFDKGENLGRLALQSVTQDISALEAVIAKAGEVMRGRCEDMLYYQGGFIIDLVRTIPVVTLKDLK